MFVYIEALICLKSIIKLGIRLSHLVNLVRPSRPHKRSLHFFWNATHFPPSIEIDLSKNQHDIRYQGNVTISTKLNLNLDSCECEMEYLWLYYHQ